jgi:hypothetical protein
MFPDIKTCETCGVAFPRRGPGNKCPNRKSHPPISKDRKLVKIIHVYSDGSTETFKVKPDVE